MLTRFLSLKYGMVVAVVVLVFTLNSTLLFFSQLLQQSNARLYHHGEGKSYMSINVALDRAEKGQLGETNVLSPSSVLGAAVGSLSSVVDNISGKSQEHIIVSPSVDIVYTWVNGSDPRQMKGSRRRFLLEFSLPLHCVSDSFPLSGVFIALLKVKLEKMTRENGTCT